MVGKWNPENDPEFRSVWADGLSVRLIAKKFNVSMGTVGRRRKFLGLPERGSPFGGDLNTAAQPRVMPDFSFPDFKEKPHED